MAKDVQVYCQQCTTCQQTKFPNPGRASMCNIPIGQLWEMLAADILELPVSRQNHHYLATTPIATTPIPTPCHHPHSVLGVVARGAGYPGKKTY